MRTDVDKKSRQYFRQSVCLTAAMYFISLLVVRIGYRDELLMPAAVSTVFSLVFAAIVAFAWKRVASRRPDQLPTFHMGVSGGRMLAALFTMLVYYLATGRQSMLTFVLVFLTFYVVHLVHHSVFFARESNRSGNAKN
ncbi:MAG: hypothetical protein IJV36_04730 [Prevotella sp.]|nr:hypothetical protein [Prevotella sp.]